MADEYIRREDAKIGLSKTFGRLNADIANYVIDKVEPADVVSVSAYKQVMLERDTAVEQLKQIGKDVREVTDDVVHLQRLLSADIAKIVRCKNCKYRSYDEIFECNWCEHEGMVREVKPDFYCGYGEE